MTTGARTILSFAVGPVASGALGFFSVPLIAFAFHPDDVGRYSLYQTTVSFLLLFSTLGLDQAFVREYHEKSDQAALLRACVAPGLLAAGAIVVVAAGGARPIARALYGLPDGRLTLVTAGAFVLSFAARYFALILRMQERGLAYSLTEVVQRALVLVLVGVVALSGDIPAPFSRLLWIIFASLSAVVTVAGWSTHRSWWPALWSRVAWSERRPLLALALPLLVSSVVYWGLAATNVFALRRWSTLGELALFGLSVSVANAAAIFQAVVTVVWAPIVYKWVARGADFGRIDAATEKVLALVCAIFVACGVLSPLLDLILPPSYAEVKYLVLCAIVPPLLYTLSEMTGIGITVSRRTVLSIWVTLAALLTSVVLAAALVPRLGARGGAVAYALSFLVFFVGRTEASNRVWRPTPVRRLYAAVGCAVALSVFTALFGSVSPMAVPALWLVAGGVVWLAFRSSWRDLYHDLGQLRRS